MDPDEDSTNESTTSSPKTRNPFKIEWSLFWGGLLGDNGEAAEDPLKSLTRDQITKVIKDLSSARKKLHKEIESVNREIELNSTKLESLKLVGSEPDETIVRLNELSDLGQELSSELQKLNQKLKWVRAHEKEISNKDWA